MKSLFKKSFWFSTVMLMSVFLILPNAAQAQTNRQNLKSKFAILKVEHSDFANVKRPSYEVYVKSPASISHLKVIAKEITRIAKNRTPFNALWIGFHNQAEYGSGVSNGYITYAPFGDWSKAMDVKTGDYSKMSYTYHLLSPVTKKNKEDLFGLTYKQQVRLYNDANLANKKAISIADKKFPPAKYLYKNIDYQRLLKNRFDVELAKKFNVTLDQYKKIYSRIIETKLPHYFIKK